MLGLGSRSVLARVALYCSLVVATSCTHAGSILPPDDMPPVLGLVGQGGGAGFIRAAVIRALIERSYAVQAEDGQQIVALYTRGRHSLMVGITYDDGSFRIDGIEATGMNGRHYTRYVGQLEQSIQAELARPDREAQERATRPVIVSVPVVGVLATSGPTCEALVVQYGHGSGATIHCRPDTDVTCADALLSMGHSAAALLHCSRVEPTCARQYLLSGGTPAGLMRCR